LPFFIHIIMKKLFLLLVFLPSLMASQVTNEGRPLSWKFSNLEVKTLVLPEFDLKAIQKEDELNDKKGQGPWRFGYDHLVDVNIANDGTWVNLNDGSRFWIFNIKSEGALTMNFIFDEFFIPEGGKLYFYNSNRTDLLGAYTHTQNREDKLFGSWLVKGDDIYIEYFEPADKLGEGRLNISKAVHGYRSVTKNFNKDLNDSGACNLDVDCSIGADFDPIKDEVKKSVGLIIVGANSACSGALINNTNNDGTPYFLTADHCLFGSVGSWAFRFNWRSPNPVCATGASSPNGTFNQTVSGATLRANNPDSDVVLVEITAPVPDSWDLVWAGWDRTSTPANYTVGIHHPSGDIMKICRDNDSPTPSVQFGAQVWFVNEWEIGVTEPGSSGSPLFNQDGRIIGQLYGGSAACSGTFNNGQPDWYGRFDVSWDNGSSSSTRLKEWLDPNNTGQTILDQYPAAQAYNNDAKITITGLPSEEICGNQVQADINIENNGLDPITSATITYQFNSEPLQVVNWTGNLLNGESEIIASPVLTLNEGNNQIIATISNPNGIPDEFGGNNSTSRNVQKTLSYDTSQVFLELLTDDYGNETTWTFADENGTVFIQGGPYPDNVTINETFNVNDNTCYTFTINDTAADGICCGFGAGSYELTTDSGDVIFQGGEFGNVEVTYLGINTNLNAESFNLTSLSLYPNPTSDVLYIETSLETLNSIIYDINGKVILESNQKEIDLSRVSVGIYFIKIQADSSGEVMTRKIIKK